MKSKTHVLIAFLMVFSTQSFSQNVDVYNCIVQDAKSVDKQGLLVKNDLYSVYKNSMFVIETKTGRIVGDIVSNKDAVSTSIIDKGSEDNYYKVLSIFGPNTSILYLQVHKTKGENTPPIAFSGFRWSAAISGICK